MGKAVITILTPEDRDLAHRYVSKAPETTEITFLHRKRSDAQNRRLWPMLQDVSRQVDWYGRRLTDEDWKDMFTASMRGERVVPGIDGGFVRLGQRTSKMSVEELTALMDLISAFAAQRGVILRVEQPDWRDG